MLDGQALDLDCRIVLVGRVNVAPTGRRARLHSADAIAFGSNPNKGAQTPVLRVALLHLPLAQRIAHRNVVGVRLPNVYDGVGVMVQYPLPQLGKLLVEDHATVGRHRHGHRKVGVAMRIVALVRRIHLVDLDEKARAHLVEVHHIDILRGNVVHH